MTRPDEEPRRIAYRLSPADAYLPLHWCYSEPWSEEYDFGTGDVELVDNRAPGAQVWTIVRSLVLAMRGVDRDGHYGPDRYPVLLMLECTELSDSAGEWSAVLPYALGSCRRADVASVLAALGNALPPHVDPDDDAEVAAWADAHEVEFAALVREVSLPWEPVWIETLDTPA